jgi:hypothetical protein
MTMLLVKRWHFALWAVALFLAVGAAEAETTPPAATANDPQLEARLAAEKEARKQCKIEICKVIASGKGEPGTIRCETTKTWPDTEISSKILSGRVGWPWGHAQCSAQIELDREAIAKLVAEPEATITLKPHQLKCVIEKKAGQNVEVEAYVIKVSLAPEVTFKNGKATAVKLNLGVIEAPALLHGAIWSAMTLDKVFGFLSESAVRHTNAFVYDSCKEVGVEVVQKK